MRKGFLILFILLILWLIVRFVIGGSEDDWICVDGEWIKHGNPSSTVPDKECRN